MYNKYFIKTQMKTTTIDVNDSYEGERLEEKVSRIMNNTEPITDGAPLIYQERKEGVNADYDVRADKWEAAVDAHDKITKSRIAKREKGIKDKVAKSEGFTDWEAKQAAENAKIEQNGNNKVDNK